MTAQTKKRNPVENGDAGIGKALVGFVSNNEDLGPIVRHAFESGRPEALFHNLRSIAKRKEVEIEELCRLHYEEFILAVDELRGVLVDADELKGALSGENLRLQEVASALLLKLDELLELYAANKNVGEALATLKICLQVTSLCQACNRDIAQGKFHTVLKTLELIEKDYLQNIPLNLLRKVVQKKIPMMKLYIEKKVSGEFNEWLVYIRKFAMEIGQSSIRQASLDRQKDERMRAWQREAEECSRVGFDEHAYALDLEYIDEESALEYDLTPVYRAYNIHVSLGLGEKFREYYYSNRLMQLNLDMQISTAQPFLESHQHFLAQVAGFFIVENRVLRTAEGLLSESQVDTMWEASISKVTSFLEEQFAHMDAANHHLLVKDYVSLLAATMKKYGYQITSLLEVLDKNRDRYHELLVSDCRKQIQGIFVKDSYERMVIEKENDYNMNVAACQLEPIHTVPDLPYVAPFSSSVPGACRIIRSFIEDLVSYLSYGVVANSYDVVKRYLDKLLIEVLNDGLLTLIHNGSLEIAQLVQIAGNIAFLERSCDMFLLHATQLCGLPKRLLGKPHSGLTARAVLKASQNAAFNGLITLANSRIDEFMLLLTSIDWTTEETPEHANDYMNEVLIYLDMVVSTAQPILPREALFKVISGSLSHISDSIITVLLSDRVKRLSVNAVVGIDIDLKMLEEFAEDRFHTTGLSVLKKETSFKDCLVEIRQLTNLLLSNHAESFMNAVIREKSYASLDHKKVAIICDKFRDAPDSSLFGSLSSRNVVQSARKKSLDVLKRRLKDFS
ncbi:exocyst complex component SEC15A-like [Hordeum vulgare subsp. vulgare]|uniref:Exocyst complex component n=2 Tax=Hordeum vulgare subsp. vulgare TaxID=112509 RepID=M0Z256_HORVV|nr:exocyst complex component SEC15A-like [Hordeum vulgare subsp. vulgare]